MFRNKQVDAIVKIFSEGNDMYENHHKTTPLLEEMAEDKNILYDIIRYNLDQPAFLKRVRHYSTLSMDIIETPDFNFVVNIFPSLPDKNQDISFQSVHHHGNMLLSTIGAFGPGYKAITFKKDFQIEKNTGLTIMSKEKVYQNTLHNFDFIDANTPHIVFYPSSISATYALWSNKTKTNTGSRLKKIPLIGKFKKQLRTIIEILGIEKLAGINKVEYLDFYPKDGKLVAMKQRIHYNSAEGSNDNFIQNIFHFIQKTGFNDITFLKTILAKNATPGFAKICINDLIEGKKIDDQFINSFLNIDKVNLDYLTVVNATN